MTTPTAADLEKARACMRLDAGPDWVANVAAALAEEREAERNAIIMSLPGGQICDPQAIADTIRARGK